MTNLGVDLGTANTIVFADRKGYVINQPSVIALNDAEEVVAFGADAKLMLGKTGKYIHVVRPLADGVIADFTAGDAMVREFIRSAHVSRFRIGRVVVGVPTGITDVERRAVIESAEMAGAREVYLVAEPMAAAIGTGLDVTGRDAHMIVDIGGGTTDIAVINYGGIVVDNTIRIAGDEMNESIVRFLKNHYHLTVGEASAERMKIEYGTVSKKYNSQVLAVKGVDSFSGMPRQLELSNSFFIDALAEVTETVVRAVLRTLEQLPPDLCEDILQQGIILAGGGALLRGLQETIRDRIRVPVSVADDALFCVAEGTRRILEDFDHFKPVLYHA